MSTLAVVPSKITHRRMIACVGDDALDLVEVAAAALSMYADTLVIDLTASRTLYHNVGGTRDDEYVVRGSVRYTTDAQQYYDAPSSYELVILYMDSLGENILSNLAEHIYIGYGFRVRLETVNMYGCASERCTLVCRMSPDMEYEALGTSECIWWVADKMYVPVDAVDVMAVYKLRYSSLDGVDITNEMWQFIHEVVSLLGIECVSGINTKRRDVCWR